MRNEKITKTCYSVHLWGLVIVFLFAALQLPAQKPIEYDKIKSFNIIVNYPDCTVKTQMLKDPKKIEANENYVYHWYTSNKIMATKGGYDGKLLNGYYHCFYLNNNLKESGNFKYGIKNGEWRYWFEDGKLKEIIHWKKGIKNGKYKLYNQLGDLIAESNFKNDKLDGKFKTYSSGKLIETLKYKNGELVVSRASTTKAKKEKKEPSTNPDSKEPKVKKEKRSFKERWNSVFKKKDSSDKSGAKEPKKKKEPTKKKEKEPKKKKSDKKEPATSTTN